MRILIAALALCLLTISCKTASIEPPPKVSVICPTYNRPDKHPLLYAAFNQQTYPNKELLVHDDSKEPSPFFQNLEDDRVTYLHNPERKSIGKKRNELIALSQGEIIAQFDDDDYYAPKYLEKMVSSLGDADFVTLSTWHAYRETDHTLWHWDTTQISPLHYAVSGDPQMDKRGDISPLIPDPKSYVEENIWGYGFSFVFKKSLWEESPFLNFNRGEDRHFSKAAQQRGKILLHVPDEDHLVLHVIHSKNSSGILPDQKCDQDTILPHFGKEAAQWLNATSKAGS